MNSHVIVMKIKQRAQNAEKKVLVGGGGGGGVAAEETNYSFKCF